MPTKKLFAMIITLFVLLMPAARIVVAQAPEGREYIVQADDWLSKLAAKEYGDPFLYPVIVAATNAKAAEDASFALIENPDLIEIGWKILIPSSAGAPSSAGVSASTGGPTSVAPSTETGATPPPAAGDQSAARALQALTANPWQWERFTEPTQRFWMSLPEKYTVTFDADGALTVQADCNSAQGVYTAGDSAISIEISPASLAVCSSESLSQEFIQHLGLAAVYFFRDGRLFIELAADGGRMEFGSATP
jgi:nucleoid-associated protein YgaU